MITPIDFIPEIPEAKLSSSVQTKLNTSGGGSSNPSIRIATTQAHLTTALTGSEKEINIQGNITLTSNITIAANAVLSYGGGIINIGNYQVTFNNNELKDSKWNFQTGTISNSSTFKNVYAISLENYGLIGDGNLETNSGTENRNCFLEVSKIAHITGCDLEIHKAGNYMYTPIETNNEYWEPSNLYVTGKTNVYLGKNCIIGALTAPTQKYDLLTFYKSVNTKLDGQGGFVGDLKTHDKATYGISEWCNGLMISHYCRNVTVEKDIFFKDFSGDGICFNWGPEFVHYNVIKEDVFTKNFGLNKDNGEVEANNDLSYSNRYMLTHSGFTTLKGLVFGGSSFAGWFGLDSQQYRVAFYNNTAIDDDTTTGFIGLTREVDTYEIVDIPDNATSCRLVIYSPKYWASNAKIRFFKGTGSIDSILIDGVNVMSSEVNYSTSLKNTTQLVADNINAHTSSPNYTAVVDDETLVILSDITYDEGLELVVNTTNIEFTSDGLGGGLRGTIFAPTYPLYTEIKAKNFIMCARQGISNPTPYSLIDGVNFIKNGRWYDGTPGSPGYGIDIEDGYQNNHHITIQNCNFGDNKGGALILKGSRYINILNNNFEYSKIPNWVSVDDLSLNNSEYTLFAFNKVNGYALGLGRGTNCHSNVLKDVDILFSYEDEHVHNIINAENIRIYSNLDSNMYGIAKFTDSNIRYTKPLGEYYIFGNYANVILKNIEFDFKGFSFNSTTHKLNNMGGYEYYPKGSMTNFTIKNLISESAYDYGFEMYDYSNTDNVSISCPVKIKAGQPQDSVHDNMTIPNGWLELSLLDYPNTNTGTFFTKIFNNLNINVKTRINQQYLSRHALTARACDVNLVFNGGSITMADDSLYGNQNDILNLPINGTKIFNNVTFNSSKPATQTLDASYVFNNCVFNGVTFIGATIN